MTALFCDLADSTAMGEVVDAERVRALLSAYFERMKAIAEQHGGQVEKFIGDAVVAVFGVPVLHEDDALRAVRAAAEMRAALPELGLAGRIGVTTGEVVTGSGQTLATGDVLNVAARLQQSAQPGEVLVDVSTVELVRESVVVEPRGALELKGKTKALMAYRLLDVGVAPRRPHETTFVGRGPELRVLQDAWDRVRADRRCELLTVIGEAGVGKSRLVAEFLRSIDARTVRGRCLPYGEGITYWPVVEVLKQLDTVPADQAVTAPIHALLGRTTARMSADEIAWAFRKTLEHAAAVRSLVVVFDDIQWGESTFLDLVEHVALLSAGATILLLCMARPELSERRSDWPVALRLDGLREEDVDALIPAGMPEESRTRIARGAGGNPLFVEEMLAVADDADGEVLVPPTLRALLGARLDQLDVAERRVLERAAVEGEVFHRGSVQALSADDLSVTPCLAALVRRRLIQPERAQLVGEDGFRFRHLLIRDAAYDSLPKAARAELHVRFATWVRQRWADLVELEEILGYHLEQAVRYQAELGLPRDEAVATAAVRHLSAASWHADARGDAGAVASLRARAASLLPPDRIDLEIETDLIDAFIWTGNTAEALRRADSLVARARASGDQVAGLCGRIQADYVRLYVRPEGIADHLEELIQTSLPVFRAAENRTALHLAYFTLAWVKQLRGRMREGLDAVEQAVEYRPERAGDLRAWRGGVGLVGPTPVEELLQWLDEPEQRQVPDRWLDADRAHALAMLGRIDEARVIMADLRTALADRGAEFELAIFTGDQSAEIELLAGDSAAAAAFLSRASRQLESLGDHYHRPLMVARLAQVHCILGQLDDADELVECTTRLGADDDVGVACRSRQAKAIVLAHRGRHCEAEELARAAVAIAETTDVLTDQGDAYADLAGVLALGGKAREATAVLHEALDRYDRKGNLVMSQRIRQRLTDARSSEPA